MFTNQNTTIFILIGRLVDYVLRPIIPCRLLSANSVYISIYYQDSLESKMTLWKDKVTLQKVGVTSWKDRNATNMDKTIKGKCPQGVCSGEGEYITHHTCSNGNELDMDPATTCDCGREFNSLRGLRIHKARWCKQRNSPAGECKSNDELMN